MTATDLRLGDWESVLDSVASVDATIVDPPYGSRTHASIGERDPSKSASVDITVDYDSWTVDDVFEFVRSWSPRTRGWMVALTSHDLIPAWTDAYSENKRYAFAPVPCVMRGMSVRLQGDGPSSWAVYAMVARPRTAEFAKWGTLPGAYITGKPIGGSGRGKPIDLMRSLVADYSRYGDLVCDPCAGFATTALAARSMGRSFIGAEMDAAVFAEAKQRLNAATPGILGL